VPFERIQLRSSGSLFAVPWARTTSRKAAMVVLRGRRIARVESQREVNLAAG
jgi:hypothetical protein